MGGSLLIAIAITLQALSNGVLSDNLTATESLLLSFTAFSLSALVFGLIARIRRTQDQPPLRGERLHTMLLLNAATAVTFLGFYWSLSLIPAPLATATETGIGPLAMACLRIRQTTGTRRLAELALGALTLTLALSVADRMATNGQIESLPALAAGIAVAAIAGSSAAAIALISHRLGQLHVSAVRVTAHRFHLTYLIALAALLFGTDPHHTWTPTRVAFITSIAVLGATLPLFVLQIGMQRTSPLTVTLLASAVPGVTYLTASSLGPQSFDIPTFALINTSLLLAFLGPTLVNRLSKPTSPPTPQHTKASPGAGKDPTQKAVDGR